MRADEQSYLTIFRNFGSFSYKSLLARSIELLSSFGSSYFLAMININNLLAGGLITSVQNFILRTGRLSLFGTPALLKNASGLEEEATLLQQSRNLALVLSIPMIAIYCTSGLILGRLGQEHEIVSIVQDYFYGYSWGVPAVLLQVSNQQFLYFKKMPWTVCILNAIQTAFTLGFGAIATFGVKALPAFGARGLGHTTSAVSWLMFLGTMFFLVRRYGREFNFKLVSPRKLKEIAKLGMPIAVQLGAELLSLTAAVQMCGLIGPIALAAAEATLQWTNYIIIPMQTLSQVANILVSQELRENQLGHARKIGNISPVILSIFPALCLIIFGIFGRPLASVFLNIHNFSDEAQRALALDSAKILMLFTCGTLVIDAIRTGFAGSLRGYGYTRIPGVTGFINLGLLALGGSYIMGMRLGFGASGVFGARILPTIIDSIILIFLWLTVSKNYHVAVPVTISTIDANESTSSFSWLSALRFWRRRPVVDERTALVMSPVNATPEESITNSNSV